MSNKLKNIIFRFVDNLFGEYKLLCSPVTGRIFLLKGKFVFAEIKTHKETFHILESHFYLVKDIFGLNTQEEVSDLFCEWLKIREGYEVKKTWQSFAG